MSINVATVHLSKDPVMGKLITKFKLEIPPKPDNKRLFRDVVEAIIGQQLSNKAANTIIDRFIKLFDKKGKNFPAARQILQISDEKIRQCGTSWAKVRYIKDFCLATQDGMVELSKLPVLADEEIIIELTKVKGIGRWTAEMILIFTLQRPDVFSLGDLGLRTAVAKLYRIDRDNLKKIAKISSKWSPHRSLASRLLWKSLDNEN